jgi:hypothetical protein
MTSGSPLLLLFIYSVTSALIAAAPTGSWAA